MLLPLLQNNLLAGGGGPATQTLTPARFDNAQAFFAHVVTPGQVTLLPALFVNSNAFYATTVTGGVVVAADGLTILLRRRRR